MGEVRGVVQTIQSSTVTIPVLTFEKEMAALPVILQCLPNQRKVKVKNITFCTYS